MRCPLFTSCVLLAGSRVDTITLECTQELCAWWDKEHGICGELSKVKALRTISSNLNTIAKELTLIRPHL